MPEALQHRAQALLDVVPEMLHQRVPFFAGSIEDVQSWSRSWQVRGR